MKSFCAHALENSGGKLAQIRFHFSNQLMLGAGMLAQLFWSPKCGTEKAFGEMGVQCLGRNNPPCMIWTIRFRSKLRGTWHSLVPSRNRDGRPVRVNSMEKGRSWTSWGLPAQMKTDTPHLNQGENCKIPLWILRSKSILWVKEMGSVGDDTDGSYWWHTPIRQWRYSVNGSRRNKSRWRNHHFASGNLRSPKKDAIWKDGKQLKHAWKLRCPSPVIYERPSDLRPLYAKISTSPMNMIVGQHSSDKHESKRLWDILPDCFQTEEL